MKRITWHLEVKWRNNHIKDSGWQPTGRDWYWFRRDAVEHYKDMLLNSDPNLKYRITKYIAAR